MANIFQKRNDIDLTDGPILKALVSFSIPLLFGQLLQQLYNMADAWVVGNFAPIDAFSGVTVAGNLTWVIIGLFNGMSVGGGVVVSRWFGAKNEEMTRKAIHSNLLFGILASVGSTAIGLILVPILLNWMETPASVMPEALSYLNIYFGGVSTVIMYNTCMSIMRAVGDSVRPLYYLAISSVVNVVLDLVFVAGLDWGAGGASLATVIAQGLSVLLCLRRMLSGRDAVHIDLREMMKLDAGTMASIFRQGFPGGIQNTVNSIGNMVVQSCINLFGTFAISGYGAFHKIEGLAFLPIMSVSMALPTFVSQNIGAGKVDRAKKGAWLGIAGSCVLAECMGGVLYLVGRPLISAFISEPQAIEYGVGHSQTVAFFLFLLAFTHCAAGALRGCGRAVIPMATLLLSWCGIRILYVTSAIKIWPVFRTISWAYPITWGISAVILLVCMLRVDWSRTKI